MVRVQRRLHQMMHRVVSTRLGTWWFSQTQHYIDRFVHGLTGGRATMAGFFSGLPVVLLTTTGAKSGKTRTVPLLCTFDDRQPETFVVVASNFGKPHHPAWYYNVKANGRVKCELPGHTGVYTAIEAEGEVYDRYWRLATAAYPGYAAYQLRAAPWRQVPIIVLTPGADPA